MIFLSMNNFGLRFGIKCMDLSLFILLVLLRSAMILYCGFFIWPDSFKMMRLVYYWRKTPGEQKDGVLNAIVCWVIWSILRSLIFFAMYLLPVILISLAIKLKRQQSWPLFLREGFCSFSNFIFVKFLGSIILGTSLDHLTSWSMSIAGVPESELVEKMLRERKNSPIKNILFDEAKDCPICLE